MNDDPRIPMSPDALPQQRLYLVRGLPDRPRGWATSIGSPGAPHVPAKRPRSARYVGQVEWAWSPMHSRIDAYYLSTDRTHARWLLWLRFYDDNWSRWEDGDVVAWAPRRGGLRPAAAAKLLLADWWRSERDDGVDRFHWVNGEGLLDSGDMTEAGDAAWDGE
jgi:hypothetical protein